MDLYLFTVTSVFGMTSFRNPFSSLVTKLFFTQYSKLTRRSNHIGEVFVARSYFMQMLSEFDVNLMSQTLLSQQYSQVEQSWTAVIYSLLICDVNIHFAFAFAESA